MAKRKARKTATGKQSKTVRKRNDKRSIIVKPPLVPLHTPGVTGLKRWDQYVHDEWHPKLRGKRGLKIFREMSDNDAVLGSVGFGMRSHIQQADINIDPAEKSQQGLAIANHIEESFGDMTMTPAEFVSDALSMIWAGHSYHGIYYKIRRGIGAPLPELRSKFDDGKVGWRKLPIRAQDTLDGWDFAEDGDIEGAWQQAPPKYKRIHLPIYQHLLFRTVSNKNNPEGRSLYRNAYRSWFFLKRIQELEAIGVERDMAGLLVFHLPPEYFDEDADDDQQQTVENYRLIGERMRRGEHECLTFPAEEDEDGKTGWAARLMQSGGRRPIDTDAIVKRLESRIAITVLGEAVLLGMQGNIGSWSLASSKTHMFAIAVRAVMRSIEDVMTRFAIPRLVELNRWPAQLSPSFKFGDTESDDLGELMAALSAGVGVGLVTPGPELEQYLRIRAGLPLEDDVSEMQLEDALGQVADLDAQGPAALQAMAADDAAQKVVPIDEQSEAISETLSAEDAAEVLGVPRRIVNSAVRRGQLAGVKIGNKFRIHRQSLVQAMRGKLAA